MLHVRDAVEGVGLEPLYQPIVSLPAEVIVGFEALARWPTGDGLQLTRQNRVTGERIRRTAHASARC
jgi:sensor c-di-GMP phosphodiesterase-like protein